MLPISKRRTSRLKAVGKRWGRAFVLLSVLSTLVPSSHLGQAAIPGTFCGGPKPIAAVGSVPQQSVHLSLFQPTYYAACPEAAGTISYQGIGGQPAIDYAQRHNVGPDSLFSMYTTDLQMSDQEWYSTYMDAYNPFTPRILTTILHLPVYIDGVAIGYNLGACSSSQPLRLTRTQLSLIYSGAISRWNDVGLRSSGQNQQLASCNLAINVSVRADFASSSHVIKDYMSRDNTGSIWRPYKLKQLNSAWPSSTRIACYGVGELGMGQCLGTPGSIGYIQYRSAASSLLMAEMENGSSGTYVSPSTSRSLKHPDNCQAAASSTSPTPASTSYDSVSLTGTGNGYALCSFSYILVFEKLMQATATAYSTGQVRNTVDYLTTLSKDPTLEGVKDYGYTPLPSNWRGNIRSAIGSISYF